CALPIYSEAPRNQLAPRTPNTGYKPENKRAIADERNERLRLVRKPLLVAEEREDQHHRCADQVQVAVALEQAGLSQDLDESVHGLLLCRGRDRPRWTPGVEAVA